MCLSPLVWFVFSWILKAVKSDKIFVSPYLNAFKVYQKQSEYGQQTFTYANPPIHDFNVTIESDGYIDRKLFLKSDLKVTIHADRSQFYDLENSDAYRINSICKFDHNHEIHLYSTICCRITIQDYTFNTNEFYSEHFCKYALSHRSSACFMQLIFLKSFILKNLKRNHYYFGLKAFAFATSDESCGSQSAVMKLLAISKLYPLSFSNGLSVYWTEIFKSKSNLSLEIGRPFHSVDPDSFISLPIRMLSDGKFRCIKTRCSSGYVLDIKSILFDSELFQAEYENNNNILTVYLINKMWDSQTTSSQWWIDEGTLLFIIRAQINDISMLPKQTSDKDAWIKCSIDSLKCKSETKDAVKVVKSNMVHVSVNTDKFIVIPILECSSYFSVFSSFDKPIFLKDGFITLYSVHNIRDGSVIDVTNKAICYPIMDKQIMCPPSLLKSVNRYCRQNKCPNNKNSLRMVPGDLDLVIELETWKSIIHSPVELWIPEDMRLDVSDKILNTILNWRYPASSEQSRKVTCRPLFQRAYLRLFLRLSNRNSIGEKDYYGANPQTPSPLLDFTSVINKSFLQFVSSKVSITYDETYSMLIPQQNSGFGEVDIRLYSLVMPRQILAIERIRVSPEFVTVSKLRVYCINRVRSYENDSYFSLNFQRFFVEYVKQNETSGPCFLHVIIEFSDYSEILLNELPQDYYDLYESHIDYSENKYILRKIDLSKPIGYAFKMNLSLYESSKCSDANLVFNELVFVNYDHQDSYRIRTTPFEDIQMKQSTAIPPIVKEKVPSKEFMVNLSSLYYGLYALIILVAVVALIVLINCLVKLNYRKISQQISSNNSSTNQPVTDKLLSASESQPSGEPITPTFAKHPPLLPPPGPLRDMSDSQVELASSTFWSASSQDSPNYSNKKYSSSLQDQPISLSPMNVPLMKSSPLVCSVYSTSKYRHNPSPSSDQADGGYLSGENNNWKMSDIPMQTFNYNQRNSTNSDSDEKSKNSVDLSSLSCSVSVPPPCPPLKWSIQWGTSVASAIPVFAQSSFSNRLSELKYSAVKVTSPLDCSIPLIGQWIPAKPLLQLSQSTIPYTKSIDNLCEKSSGLGSLTSTQQEDYSILSDEENYHVSINSDKETYKKYTKKC